MRVIIFLLFFYPIIGYSQKLPAAFKNKLQILYCKGSYNEVLQTIYKFQDKGNDNPYIYKCKGTYRKNFEMYNYKFKAEFALVKSGNNKMMNEALLDYSYLLTIASPEQLNTDSLIYQEFHSAIQLNAQQAYLNHKWREAEINLLYLARVFKDTIPEYRKMFEPWFGITQEPSFRQIDSLASLPMKFSPSGKLLANYLTKGLKGDSSKARAIFVWIASHIEYGRKNEITIYKAKRGVCIDYAILFKELAIHANIDSVYIVLGIAKGKGYNPAYPMESKHSWNAIKLNGAWKLIETTWASCSGEWSYNYYFCADPKLLITTHFPFNSYWQLLDEEISFDEFVHGKEIANR